MPIISCFQLLKCEDLLLYSIKYNCNLNIFGFCTVDQTEQGSDKLRDNFQTFHRQNSWKNNQYDSLVAAQLKTKLLFCNIAKQFEMSGFLILSPLQINFIVPCFIALR